MRGKLNEGKDIEILTIGCFNADKEKWSWAACDVSCLGVWGREGEEGTTAELGDGGKVESSEREGEEDEGEKEGDPLNELSGTRGDEGSERHDEEDKDVGSKSREGESSRPYDEGQ